MTARSNIFHRQDCRTQLLAPRKRLSYMRKVDFVVALRAGLVTRDELIAAHGLTEEELRAWYVAFETGGVKALRLSHRCKPQERAA